MIKKWTDLNDKERYYIHQGIFFLLVFLILMTMFNGWVMYKEQGFNYCVEEKVAFNDVSITTCFNTSKERNDYVLSKSYPNNLDYKYINQYINITIVE